MLSVSHTVLIKVPDGQIEMPDGLLDVPQTFWNLKCEIRIKIDEIDDCLDVVKNVNRFSDLCFVKLVRSSSAGQGIR